MIPKRPRKEETTPVEALGNAEWGNNAGAYGQDLIRDIVKYGNPTFARGAFGELSLALAPNRNLDQDAVPIRRGGSPSKTSRFF